MNPRSLLLHQSPPPQKKTPRRWQAPRLGRVGQSWLQVESLYTVDCCTIQGSGSVWIYSTVTSLTEISASLYIQGLPGCASFCHNPQCSSLCSSRLHRALYACKWYVGPCALLLKRIPWRFYTLMYVKPQAQRFINQTPCCHCFSLSSVSTHKEFAFSSLWRAADWFFLCLASILIHSLVLQHIPHIGFAAQATL